MKIVFDKVLARVARFTRFYRFETKFDTPLGDNVTTGLNLLQSFVDHGVKRVILSSTANLFDQPERIPIDESERIVPGGPYGGSKFILERILHWLDGICGVPFACLRYFNAAGATSTRSEDHDPELCLTPLVLQFALGKREKVSIFGDDYPTRDGTCGRYYIHVIDLAQANILALGALEGHSRSYSLGSGKGFTVKDVIDTAGRITGRTIRADAGPQRAGDPAVLVAGSNKIRKELGWASRFPHVREIVESAWQWPQANPNGY